MAEEIERPIEAPALKTLPAYNKWTNLCNKEEDRKGEKWLSIKTIKKKRNSIVLIAKTKIKFSMAKVWHSKQKKQTTNL